MTIELLCARATDAKARTLAAVIDRMKAARLKIPPATIGSSVSTDASRPLESTEEQQLVRSGYLNQAPRLQILTPNYDDRLEGTVCRTSTRVYHPGPPADTRT